MFLYHSHHGKLSSPLPTRTSQTEQSYRSPLVYPSVFPGRQEEQVEFTTKHLLSVSHTVLLSKVAGVHL